ncbi:SGNH/GDSL hydrolase family protein [Niallia endozanthoxylica]|uniref:SGNH/GDSL hydrolase family protein n=1 Tax=Niallia endozanthoxylica TaxID=2036016 RepID=A0A5J5GXY1_9BACI|nr:SGNH/GDSL hydrolase family protein [Niallia endozanthoxylica]KAA9012847.1 SGNH/GDSL hydrolase family protein [Niallia endozanthoxylica]
MKIYRFSIILVFILILNTLAAPFAFAKNASITKPKLNIVALGDSITFGYPPPSTTAFPDLISGARKVVKFGGSGATSSQLLAAINSNPKEFKASIKRADVITINIGSNDFMQATGVATLFSKLQPLVSNLEENLANGKVAEAINNTPLTPLTPQQLQQYTTNLVTIIETIKKHTKAPILLYNLYNPIVISSNEILNQFLGPLHTFVEGNVTVVNSIIQQVGDVSGAHVIDAYSTFKTNPAAYIIPFDIHPTPAGHQALATLADSKLQSLKKGGKEGKRDIGIGISFR